MKTYLVKRERLLAGPDMRGLIASVLAVVEREADAAVALVAETVA